VVGGGAAGYFAAIRCASAAPRLRVTLLEGTRRPLTKVKISGGGRCNVTHHCFDPAELVKSYPRGARELRGAFSRFQPADTVRWFQERGVPLKAEADGRMFPTTDDSQTVIDCLQREADRHGVDVQLGALVRRIERDAATFTLRLQDGRTLAADRLLLATGSAPPGHAMARSLGHAVGKLVPSLFTFNVADPRLKDLAGVAFPQAALELVVGSPAAQPLRQTGPVLITHWGFSGPAVLKLSAFGAELLHDSAYRARLICNFLPPRSHATVLGEMLAFKEANPRKQVAKSPPPGVAVPYRFWESLARHVEVTPELPWAEIGKKHLSRLAQDLTSGEYAVDGKGVFKEEFVTCGGVALGEIDFRTMESRVCPGLYVAGELLDVDGITGGFNFQSAWTTGWIAGTAMAGVS
jgi:predicted Rossmann fold flavoprotein